MELGITKKLKDKIDAFSTDDQDRLIRMGWEDRTAFENIERQFNLSPNEFVQVMRHLLDRKAFERWRRRVHDQGHLKNEKKRGFKTTRFKSSRQSVDGVTKGWK